MNDAPLLIKNARLPNGSIVDLLAGGGRLLEMGARLDCRLKHQRVFDAAGRWAVPGLLDQHVHVTGGGGEGGFANKVPELALSDCVRGGVTTLVGLLGTDGTTRNVESLVAKTKAFRAQGLTAYCLTGSYELPSPTVTGTVKGDIVFIEEVIGVKLAISDHRGSNPSKADLVRLASEARLGGVLAGKPGVVHLHVGAGKRGLGLVFDILETEDIPASVFRPTHMGRRLDEAIRFAELGGWVDFTAGENARESAELLAEALRSAPADRVTLSSDANGSMPKWNEKKELVGMGAARIDTLHGTLRSLVRDLGLPLAEALKPMTENVARALGLYPRKGILAEGSDADLLLLDDDLGLSCVVAGGRLMMEDERVLAKGVFED